MMPRQEPGGRGLAISNCLIEIPFVSICVSVAPLYLSVVIRKGMQVISKQISDNCFLFTRIVPIFAQTCKNKAPKCC